MVSLLVDRCSPVSSGRYGHDNKMVAISLSSSSVPIVGKFGGLVRVIGAASGMLVKGRAHSLKWWVVSFGYGEEGKGRYLVEWRWR